MKRDLILLGLLVLSAFFITDAQAQFKVHSSGQVSFMSTTTANGIQIDPAGRISVEPNIATSYCRTGQTKVNSGLAKAWIVKNPNVAAISKDVFYVLGGGDIYGGNHYSVPNNPGSKDAQPIDDAVEILEGLTGYYFDNHEYDGFEPDFEGNPEVDPEAIPGLLKNLEIDKVSALDAAELEEVFPLAVRHDPQGRTGINYSALIPVLIEAFKEQQAKIEELEAVLKENGLVKP